MHRLPDGQMLSVRKGTVFGEDGGRNGASSHTRGGHLARTVLLRTLTAVSMNMAGDQDVGAARLQGG